MIDELAWFLFFWATMSTIFYFQERREAFRLHQELESLRKKIGERG